MLDCDQISQAALPGRRLPLPESRQAVREIVTLPCFPELTTAELDQIIDAADRACRQMSA